MALERGTTYIELRAKLDALERDLKRGEDLTKKAATNAGQAIDKGLGAKLDSAADKAGKFASRMKFVSAIAGAGLLYAAKKASDLNEAINITGLVFEDSSDVIGEFAENAASSIGQSERAAREATATFGGLLKNLQFSQDETVQWSQDLTVLASDLASAFNTRPEDAVLALGSALRGETEPIRRYNVMLDDTVVREQAVSMGLAKTTAEVDKNGKAQAALALIMEQTADVQGDFANTADGAANAQRIAAAEAEDAAASLGTALAPILGKVAKLAGNVANAFASMSEGMQTATVMLVGLAFAAAPAAKAIQGLIVATKFLFVAQTGVVAMTGFQVAIARLGVAAIGATGAIAGIGAAILAIPALDLAIDKWEDFGAALAGVSKAALTDVEAALSDALVVTVDLAEKFRTGAISVEEYQAAMAQLSLQLPEFKDRFEEIAQVTLKNLTDENRKARGELEHFGETADKTGKKIRRFANLSGKEFKDWKVSTTDNFNTVKDALGTLADKHKVTAATIIRSFRRALRAQVEFGENWDAVVNRMGPKADDLLKYIQDNFGTDAPQIVAALAEANDREFARIVRSWNEGGRRAKELAGTVGESLGGVKDDIDSTGGAAKTSADKVEELNVQLRRLNEVPDVKVNITGPSGDGLGITGPAGTPTSMFNALNAIVPGGQVISSGYRPGAITSSGNPSLHGIPPPWNAVDVIGANLLPFAQRAAASYGDQLRELIYTPLGYSIKNGVRVAPIAASDHYDHVHMADFGARIRGPATVRIGNISEDVHFVPRSGPGAVPLGGDTYNFHIVADSTTDAQKLARVIRKEFDKVSHEHARASRWQTGIAN